MNLIVTYKKRCEEFEKNLLLQLNKRKSIIKYKSKQQFYVQLLAFTNFQCLKKYTFSDTKKSLEKVSEKVYNIKNKRS